MANIEIKARCADLASARIRVEALATSWVGVEQQVDTYFCTQRGRLKLRESSRSGAHLIPYLRPDQEGPKRSDYLLVPVAEPGELRRLLGELLGVHKVVRKEREIARVGNVRVHLDRVEGLGTFLELEAVFDASSGAEAEERKKVDRLMEQLGIRAEDLIDTSYEAMVEGTE